MFNMTKYGRFSLLGLALSASAMSVNAAPPPPPAGARLELLSCAQPGSFCPASAFVAAGGASLHGVAGGADGGLSLIALQVDDGPAGFHSDMQIFAGTALNIAVATGSKVTDWIYLDDPSGVAGLLPLTYVLHLNASFSADGGHSTGGGPGPSALDRLIATLNGSQVGRVDQGWSFNGSGGPSVGVFTTFISNRTWTPTSFFADSSMRTSLANPDQLVASGGIQILAGNPGQTGPALDAAAAAVLYSLSGHDYALLPVPEIGAWALMLVGLGGLGWAVRRRQPDL